MTAFFIVCTVLILLGGIYYFKKFIRICEKANKVDWQNTWLNRLDGLNRLFCQRFHRLSDELIELPTSGPAIVVANHSSGLDPLLLLAACNRPLRFLIAREEYNRLGLTWLFKAVGCIPVDRERNPERALHEALIALNDGQAIALFPHGRIQWPTNLKAKIKGGAVRLAQRKRCAIYPLFISGVKLKGFTLPAVFVRSQIKIKAYDALECDPQSYAQCLDSLAQILNQDEPK